MIFSQNLQYQKQNYNSIYQNYQKNMQKSQKDKSMKTQKQKKISHTKFSTNNSYRAQSNQKEAPIADAINHFISHTLRPILINQRQNTKSKKQMSKTHRSPNQHIYCKTTKNKNSCKDIKKSDEKLNKYFEKKAKNILREKPKSSSVKKLKKVSTSDEILNIQEFSPDQAVLQYQQPNSYLTPIVKMKGLDRQQQELRRQLRAQMDRSKQALISTQNQKTKIVMQHQKSLNIMKEKLQNLNIQLKSQSHQRNLLQRDVKEYMKEIERVRNNLQKKQNECDQLQIEYNKIRMEHLENKNKIQEYKENINVLEQRVQTYKRKNFELEEKIDKEKKEKIQIKLQAEQILQLLRQEFPLILKKNNPFQKCFA